MAISINNLSFITTSNQESNIRNRMKSSVYSKSIYSEKTLRPKSSPIKLNPDGLETFYLNRKNQTVYNSEEHQNRIMQYFNCDRSIHSQSEPLKLYRFPSAPDKRLSPSQNLSNKTNDELKRVYNLGPGYVIHKNESEFTIRIDSDEFFGKKKQEERKEATNVHFQDHKDIIIRQLEEQISNLTVYLEEEKINHNLSLIKCQEKLESTRNIIINNYTNEIADIQDTHKEILKKKELENNKALQYQKEELDKRINKTQQELNTFKASFDSYRQALIKETDNKIELEKKQLLHNYEIELSEKLKKQRNEINCNFEVDLENIKQEHSSAIDQLNSKHKTEIDVLNRRFANSVAVEEKLSKTLQELEKRKRDYQKLQSEYDNLYETYSKSRRELTIAINENENLKSDVQEFSDRFEERVRRVDDEYKQRIDSLQNQIVEIRRAYMAKCEELVNERKQADHRLHDRIETANDVMKEIIHTRQRARISLVSLEDDSDLEELGKSRNLTDESQSFSTYHKRIKNDSQHPPSNEKDSDTLTRPVSAPTTDQDEKKVKLHSLTLNKNLL